MKYLLLPFNLVSFYWRKIPDQTFHHYRVLKKRRSMIQCIKLFTVYYFLFIFRLPTIKGFKNGSKTGNYFTEVRLSMAHFSGFVEKCVMVSIAMVQPLQWFQDRLTSPSLPRNHGNGITTEMGPGVSHPATVAQDCESRWTLTSLHSAGNSERGLYSQQSRAIFEL